MAENRWFKVWGREVLASIDLNSLTDHEERVWWRLLAAASNEEPRWTIEITPVLARFCVTTQAKLASSLATFQRRGMVRLDGNTVTFVNAEKYQETPAARRKREQREREKTRDDRGQIGDFESNDRGQERDMSRDSERDMSQDKRVTSHVTSHGSVTQIARARGAAIAIASEAEADPVGESGVTCHAADDDLKDELPLPVREIRDTVLSKLPQKYQREELTIDEVTDFAQDFAGQHREVAEAIRACRRDNELPFPGNLRKRLKPVGTTAPGPQQERIPMAEEVFEQIRNRPAVPVPDELEYLRANDPEAYERELAHRERSRAKLAAHMAAKEQAT